jgi:hypothetical protein
MSTAAAAVVLPVHVIVRSACGGSGTMAGGCGGDDVSAAGVATMLTPAAAVAPPVLVVVRKACGRKRDDCGRGSAPGGSGTTASACGGSGTTAAGPRC